MTQRFLLFIFILFTTYATHAYTITSNDLLDVKKLVGEFHKVPPEHMFCSARAERGFRWEPGGDPELVLPEITHFFSSELLRLFGWIQCAVPRHPAPLRSESINYYWDFRYGLSQAESESESRNTNNLRILTPQKGKVSSITITVLYNYYGAGKTDLQTTYILIRENGHWKIDDISLKGFELDMGDEGREWLVAHSKSLKTELQAAYKRAEAKCLQDPKCKTKMGK